MKALEAAAAANAGASAGQGAAKETESGKLANETNKNVSEQTNHSGEVEYKKGIPSQLFNKEEDELLMRMKTDDVQWPAIVAKLPGKSKKQCSQRFNEIRPDNFWEKKKGSKEKGKGSNQNSQHNQMQKKQEQKKEESNAEGAIGGGDWGNPFGAMFGFEDDKKSTASNKPSTKNDDGGAGVAITSGWGEFVGGTAEVSNDAVVTTDWTFNSNGGGGSAPDAGNDNVGGANPWANTGDNSWNPDGNANTKDQKSDGKKTEQWEQKSEMKESKPGITADAWGSAVDGLQNTGGNEGAGSSGNPGWNDNAWSTGGNEDNKSKGNGKSSNAGWPVESNDDLWGSKAEPSGNDGGMKGWGTDNGGGAAAAAASNWHNDKAVPGAANEWSTGAWGQSASSGKCRSSNSTHEKNKLPGFDAWGLTHAFQKSASPAPRNDLKKRESRRHSDSAKARHRSHRHDRSSHPTEIRIAPDDTFSQDELKLIARILQQDCSMVWERVSWRFRDKTGRNLRPDVFEKKITGKLEKERKD